MASKPPPLTHRVRVENNMIKRREKQFRHDKIWDDRKQYYDHWEKKNSKYEEWTSPRYHEANNKLIEETKKKKDHDDKLVKRREELQKLLAEEEKLYQVETMIYKTRKLTFAKHKSDDIPTEVLKEVNSGLKVEEEDRRRHEAELNLYHHWRATNPVLKHYERMYKGRELKLSWLDQQIENRMRKEKEEEECRKILKERDRMLKEEEIKQKEFQKEIEARRESLKRDLDLQVEELQKRNRISDELRRKAEEEEVSRFKLTEIEELRAAEEKKRLEKECALFNIKQYKLRLKKKAEIIEDNLNKERELITSLRDLEIAEKIQDDAKKVEINETIREILILNQEQKRLEKCRQRHLDFLFDSEAKYQFEQQDNIWRQEEVARGKLIKDVLETIQGQILFNIEKNKAKQNEIIKEREEMIGKIEEYNLEMAKLKEEEEQRKVDCMRRINEDVKVKQAKKKERENLKLKKIDEELDMARREEERLKREILNIQRKQGPIRPARSKLFL